VKNTFAATASLFLLGTLMAIANPVVGQQAYPGKPIRLIVPFPPGGGTNIVARLVGQKLAENLGQQVIVDNRPGGNTIIGTEALVRSPADGYSLILVSSAHVINSLLLPTPYDAIKDFAPVTTVTSNEAILLLHPSVPANTLQEFIALAKSKPGQINYATSGSGGIPHLQTELFSSIVGIKLQHIPYKGAGPAMTDLLGGQVQMYLTAAINGVPHIKSGKLKGIAISGDKRTAALPQVPTFAEAGLPGFDARTWYGILAPAGTPKEILDKLATEIAKVLALPDIRENLAKQGLDPFPSTPERYAALLKADQAKFAQVIRTANIKFEN